LNELYRYYAAQAAFGCIGCSSMRSCGISLARVSSSRLRLVVMAARTSSSTCSGTMANCLKVSSSRAIERRCSIAERVSTIWSIRSASKDLKEVVSMGGVSSGGLFRGAKPGGDDELVAIEIEVGGPASVLPAR